MKFGVRKSVLGMQSCMMKFFFDKFEEKRREGWSSS